MELDNETIQQIKENDRKVILRLYKNTFNVLMSVAVRYKSNREDQMSIVNAAFMKIVTGIHHYKVGTAYFSWAKKIVNNTVIDDFRANKNYKALIDIDHENYSRDHENYSSIDVQIEEEALQLMLNKLPPATKLVFNLYAFEGYAAMEICEKLGIGYETVKWHIKEARKRLRKLVYESQVIEK